jgi:phosphatidylglycerol---prolipoprotein diacylglyceryl transferase
VHPVLFHLGPVLIPAYGVMSALGVLLALALVLRTARIARVNPNQIWNLCIIALFVALAGSRLLLILVNFAVLRAHPAWLLNLAMIHHPLLAAVGALLAVITALLYARSRHMSLANTADAVAAPLALGLACEQLGALFAGSGYGTPTTVRWAVTYTSPFAERWSDSPIGVPVHPVQAYAALAFLTISIALLAALHYRRQQGDIAGLWLLLTGAAVYFTEFFRDLQGRGVIFRGALDGPQVAAIAMVIVGALLLLQRNGARVDRPAPSSESAHAIEAPHV